MGNEIIRVTFSTSSSVNLTCSGNRETFFLLIKKVLKKTWGIRTRRNRTFGEDGNPILMLNVFVQKIKLYLTSYSVHGDKTNEPGCLKQHLEELFSMYPTIQILTGDAIFAQRPLLEAIREYNRDYLFQVKDNQGNVLEQLKLLFDDAKKREPDAHTNMNFCKCFRRKESYMGYDAKKIWLNG